MDKILPSYFHIVPLEILEIIISHLKFYESFQVLKDTYYIFYRLAKDFQMWKRLLLQTRYAQLFQDYNQNTSISPDDYPKLYYTLGDPAFHFTNDIDHRELFVPSDKLAVMNIKERYKFQLKFKNLYERIKSFNIFNPVPKYGGNYIDSEIIFDQLNSPYLERYHSADMINFIRSGNIPNDYIYNETYGITNFMEINIYVPLGIFFHPDFNISIQKDEILLGYLMGSFWVDYQVYQQMCSKISKERLVRILETQEKYILEIVDDIYTEIDTTDYSDIKILEVLYDLYQRN